MEYGSSSLLFRKLLRIITVAEINDLVTLSSGRKRVSLTEIVNREMEGKPYEFLHDGESDNGKGNKAKILPFDFDISAFKKRREKPTTLELKCGARCQQLLVHWSYKFAEMDKNLLMAKRLPKRKEVIGQKQMSTFILEEKKKIKDSFSKLKKIEVMKLYDKTASINLEVEKASEDDEPTESGVLINRKQG